jgi:exonuclease III
VPGFNCIHRTNCRKGRNSEGALILAKDQIYEEVTSTQFRHYRPTIEKDFSSSGHCLFVRFQVSSVNLIMVYRSPNYSLNSFLNKLETIIKSISRNLILFGDFNIDPQKTDGKKLTQLCNVCNLESKINLLSPSTDGGTHIDCCFSDISVVEAWYYETYYSYHKAICFVWPKAL